jgi:hypothetical protein
VSKKKKSRICLHRALDQLHLHRQNFWMWICMYGLWKVSGFECCSWRVPLKIYNICICTPPPPPHTHTHTHYTCCSSGHHGWRQTRTCRLVDCGDALVLTLILP